MVTSVSGLYEVAFSEWVVALTGRDGAGFHNHSHSHLFEKLQRVVFFGFPSAVARNRESDRYTPVSMRRVCSTNKRTLALMRCAASYARSARLRPCCA
jgi:hypothetical protein